MAKLLSVNVRVPNSTRNVLRKLDDSDDVIKKTLSSAAREIVSYAKSNHFYKSHTGRLTSAIRWKLDREGNSRVATVYIDEDKAFYGKFQIQGTGIYGEKKQLIDLNANKKFKGYYWIRKNRWSFYPLTEGIKPDNFIYRAFRAKQAYIRNLFNRRVEEVVKRAL